MIELVGRQYLAHHLMDPRARHMAIGARGAHTGPIGVMNRVFILSIYIRLHLVARDAERFSVGHFEAPVESTPQQHADNNCQKKARNWPSGNDSRANISNLRHPFHSRTRNIFWLCIVTSNREITLCYINKFSTGQFCTAAAA